MTIVYLIRHGESDFNREGVFRGVIDVPLNEHGRLQAESLGRMLARVQLAAVYSSPLARALDTAHAVALPHDLEVQINEAFQNINLGSWQGKRKTEIARLYPDDWSIWKTEPERFVPPNGETIGEVRDRAWQELSRLVRFHEHTSIAIVSHRSVLKTIFASVLGLKERYFWRFYLDPASVSTVTFHVDEGFVLQQFNVTSGIPNSPKEEY
jgi:probable phosphoglycerate mutase